MDYTGKRADLQKTAYERGFNERCAQLGIDPDDLIGGVMTGECSEDTVKKAGLAKEAGMLGDWGSQLYQSTLGNIGRGVYNLGEATGINRVGRWAGGDTWQAAKSGVGSSGYKSMFNPYTESASDLSQDSFTGPTVKNLKQWDAMDPDTQMEYMKAQQAPSANTINRWRDQDYMEKLKAQNASNPAMSNWMNF